MIRVHVGYEDPRDGLFVEMSRLDRQPCRLYLGRPDAGVDDDPRVPGVEHPEIDVLQRERQWHSNPPDAVGDWLHRAGFRAFLSEGVLEAQTKIRCVRGRRQSLPVVYSQDRVQQVVLEVDVARQLRVALAEKQRVMQREGDVFVSAYARIC